jgi:catechol 2,3-dioxygenase-like lactoylglutathione lyase family enzyme
MEVVKMIDVVDSVIIYVSDLEDSITWYQQILERELSSNYGNFATFELNNVRLSLHSTERMERSEDSHSTMPVFPVEDLGAKKERLEREGILFTYENEIPNAKFATFHDPDGNPLQFIERK